MKMRTLRKLRALAPRRVYREVGGGDGAADLEPPPEAVFDRSTGPFGSHRAIVAPGGFDEET